MNGNQAYHQGLSDDDCFIRVYQLFTAIFYKCMNIASNVFYVFPIMLIINAFNDPLIMLKIIAVCRHNRRVPTNHNRYVHHLL